ncbi:gephyrin [Apiospora arundinis]
MSASSPLKVALLIVSTTAAKDPSTDASGLVDTKIVPDVVAQIQRQIMLWADVAVPEGINLILTTGGTGFAVADHTPEAVSALLHKQAPGIVHGMLAASLSVTPFAMMSRPVAGVRNKSVIITLPGSPKGAKENLQAVLKTLPHACLQAAGQDSRSLHAGGVKKLEADAGIASSSEGSAGHSHSHGSGHSHGGIPTGMIMDTATRMVAATDTATGMAHSSGIPLRAPTRCRTTRR